MQPSPPATLDAALLDRALAPGGLYPVFQPVLRLHDMQLVAHEGLLRLDPRHGQADPLALLDLARRHGRLADLESHAARMVVHGFQPATQPGKLLLNLSAQALVHAGATDDLLQALATAGCDPARCVLEITERDLVDDVARVAAAIAPLRAAGLRIALDDFGNGHSNFTFWHELTPEYVKIDRYLIDGLRHSAGRLAIVRALVDVAHALGTDLIAEGIEHVDDMRLLRDLGVRYGQGYLLGRPEREPLAQARTTLLPAGADTLPLHPRNGNASMARHVRAEDLLLDAMPVPPTTTNADAARLFHERPTLHALPVVRDGVPLGLLNRRVFMERFAQPFMRELHGRDPCTLLMSTSPIVCEADQPIESLVDILRGEDQRYLSDGFFITRNGRYAGIGTGEALVRRVTELRIEAARYANPLTLLPGNLPITQHVTRLLANGTGFAAAYFDLNHFKPFNDEYGYFRGDEVIRLVAQVLQRQAREGMDFVGHVGGDDFVVLFQSPDWRQRCERAVAMFDADVRAFFDADDLALGGFAGEDRQGHASFFPLTTLAVGVARIEAGSSLRPEDVAAQAAGAKRQAKRSGRGLFVAGETAPDQREARAAAAATA